MCVALPGRVIAVVDEEHHIVRVEVGGETHDMSAALIAEEGIGPGDWVEIHMGHAYAKLTEEEAKQMLAFMEELDAAHRGELERLEHDLGDTADADTTTADADTTTADADTTTTDADTTAADADSDDQGS